MLSWVKWGKNKKIKQNLWNDQLWKLETLGVIGSLDPGSLPWIRAWRPQLILKAPKFNKI